LACFNERESPYPVSARGGATTRKSEWHPARLQGRNRGAPLGAGTPTFDRPFHQPWGRAMKLTRGTNSLPQMTAAEFAAAMKHYGFGVCRARIVDTTGQCPGISWSAVRRGGGSVDRNKTLAKILRERDAEIARRALPGIPASSLGHEGSDGLARRA
jgi:hypothetical protein